MLIAQIRQFLTLSLRHATALFRVQHHSLTQWISMGQFEDTLHQESYVMLVMIGLRLGLEMEYSVCSQFVF